MYEGRLRSFSLSLAARTPVNGAQSGIRGNNLEPAMNDGPKNICVSVLHSANVLPLFQIRMEG